MKLSIITINLNNREGLKKTMASVFSQTFTEFEYIVIDGGSHDGSADVIREHESALTGWVSEPDGGIYQAMNKGIKRAASDYLLFLNSGDFLLNQNTLANVVHHLHTADIVYGDLRMVSKGSYRDHVYPDKLSFTYFTGRSLGHPAAFIRRTLFERVGLYDERMQICADWAFFIRAIGLFKATYQHIPVTVSVFNTDGISCLERNREIMRQEHVNLLKNDFPFFTEDYENYLDLKDNLESLRRSKPYKFLKFMGLPKYQT
jgi:glycosyltransferase involved in cell wall biosynthesis